MSTLASVVAIYKTHEQSELGIKDLQVAGVELLSKTPRTACDIHGAVFVGQV